MSTTNVDQCHLRGSSEPEVTLRCSDAQTAELDLGDTEELEQQDPGGCAHDGDQEEK